LFVAIKSPANCGARIAYIKMMIKSGLLGMKHNEVLDIQGKRVTRLTESVWSVDGKVHGLRGAVLALEPSEEKGARQGDPEERRQDGTATCT
jgi:hypothetical protein